jgi:hypothetical protein
MGCGCETYGSRCAGRFHLHRSALLMRNFGMGSDGEHKQVVMVGISMRISGSIWCWW